MASLGTAFITILPDSAGFAGALQAQVSTATDSVAARAGRLGSTLTRSLTLPIVGIGVAAGALAADFELSFSRIEGLVGASKSDIEGYKEAVLGLAGETTRAPKELAEALYFITSSGQSGAQALETLKVSAKAAAAGLGDTQTVADAVTSSMNAYGPSVLSAGRATDILVAGVKEGKAEASELAAGIGNLAPLASQLGVSFEDLTATIAAMTKVGVDTDTAFTNVSAILSGLLKTAPQSEKALESVGLSSAELRDTISKPGGLVEALRQIDVAFGGNEEAMAAVFPNIRALRGVMSLLAQNGAEVDSVFQGVTDSTGDLDHAFGAFERTSAAKFQGALTDLKTAGIELGASLLPIGTKIAGFAASIASGFAGLPSAAQNIILFTAGAAALAGPLLKLGQLAMTAGSGFSSLAGALGMSAGSLGLAVGIIGVAVAGLGASFLAAQQHQAEMRRRVEELTAVMNEQNSAIGENSRAWLKNALQSTSGGRDVVQVLGEMGLGVADLEAALASGGEGWRSFGSRVLDAARAMGIGGQDFILLANALMNLGDTYSDTNKEIENQGAVFKSAQEGADAYGAALTSLNTSIATNGASLATHTRQGQANRAAFEFAAQAATNHAQAVFTETGSIEAANTSLSTHAAELVNVAMQTGMTEQQAARYVAKLFEIPASQATNITNTADLAAALVVQYLAKVNNIPPDKLTNIIANSASAEEALLRVQAYLNGIQDKNVNVRVNFEVSNPGVLSQINNPSLGRQHGGPVPGLPGQAVPILAHAGEYVLDPGTVDAIKRGKQSAGAASGGGITAGGGTTIIVAKTFEEAIAAVPAGARGVVRAHLERRN